jgi:hypothetical protein
VPRSIHGATPVGDWCQVAPAEYLLNIPGTARYYVRNGNEVRLEIEPSAPIANISTYLLGSVFGILCHQNGMLPLLSRKGAEHERPRPVPPKPAPAAWRLPMNKVSLLIA